MGDLSPSDMHTRSEARLEVCRGCPKLFKPTMTCKSCGCFLRLKVLLPASTCPEGKW